MFTDHSRVRAFVRWASEEGREEMLNAIRNSPRYAGQAPQVIENVLEDHLSVINNHGLVIGAPRIRILLKEYAPASPTAPIVSTEDLASLEAQYDPVAHR